jgi:hypothetical protein
VLVAVLEEDELCPRALMFRGRTIVIVSIIKNGNDENNITGEENAGTLKVIYYFLSPPLLLHT